MMMRTLKSEHLPAKRRTIRLHRSPGYAIGSMNSTLSYATIVRVTNIRKAFSIRMETCSILKKKTSARSEERRGANVARRGDGTEARNVTGVQTCALPIYDEDAQIRALTGKTPHNTVTPIARIRDRQYELDLVLRNNRTSDEHPQGIFHPHGDVQHIKKENIGLIEVMGLAVLPARLKGELNEIKQFLLGQKSAVAPCHQQWADEMKTIYGEMTDAQKVDAILEKELGKKFTRVLEDAGVFKERKAFERFIAALN